MTQKKRASSKSATAVFLHIRPTVGTLAEHDYRRTATLVPDLAVSLYRDGDEAQAAQKIVGGLVN